MNVRRAALGAFFAVLVTSVGALAAYAFHWYVVQPSDDELLAHAREIEVPGLVADGEPVVVGAWAPSFDRGSVVLDATADASVDGVVVQAALTSQGWEVVELRTRGPSEIVTASRGAVDLVVRVPPPQDGVSTVTVELTRGDVSPSLTVTVLLGTGLGLAAGAWLGVRVARRQSFAGRHSVSRTAYT